MLFINQIGILGIIAASHLPHAAYASNSCEKNSGFEGARDVDISVPGTRILPDDRGNLPQTPTYEPRQPARGPIFSIELIPGLMTPIANPATTLPQSRIPLRTGTSRTRPHPLTPD